MGHEVRRVSATWQHPRDENGEYIPLFNDFNNKLSVDWDEAEAKWNMGLMPDYVEPGEWKPIEEGYKNMSYAEYIGPRPDEKDYMPVFSDPTHLQMYENTTEGTPISPVFATPEELARWLSDNKASACGRMTATYEQWLATCKRGWAPTAMYSPSTGFISGVAASL